MVTIPTAPLIPPFLSLPSYPNPGCWRGVAGRRVVGRGAGQSRTRPDPAGRPRSALNADTAIPSINKEIIRALVGEARIGEFERMAGGAGWGGLGVTELHRSSLHGVARRGIVWDGCELCPFVRICAFVSEYEAVSQSRPTWTALRANTAHPRV